MPKAVIQRAEARRDLANHFAFVGTRSLRAAEKFLAVVEEVFDFLSVQPTAGAAWEGSNPMFTGLRVWPLLQYRNYVIYYRQIPDGIEIIRVLHGAQDAETIFGT